MTEYIALFAAHVVSILIILAAVFIRRPWLRPVGAIAGAVALWLPLFALLSTLGEANPFPPEGRYRMIASKMHDDQRHLYMFVDTLDNDPTPRLFRIPFDRSKFDRLDATDYASQVVSISGGEGGDFEVVYVDYQPPDLLKDDVMRGYQDPRPND